MGNDFQSILDQSLSDTQPDQTQVEPVDQDSTSNVVLQKQAEVVKAAQQIKTNLSGNQPIDNYRIGAEIEHGSPSPNAPEMEKDLLTLDPASFHAKWGSAGDQAALGYAQNSYAYNLDRASQRGTGQMVSDAIEGALGLTGSSAVGVVGAGVGAVAPAAGATIAQWGNDLSSWVNNHESSAIQAHRRAGEARSQIYSAENEFAHQKDISEGDGEFVAGLKNFGRSFVSSVKNATDDPMLLGQATADNAGALLINYFLTDGMGALASKLAPAVSKTEMLAAKAGQVAGVATEAQAAAATKVGKLVAFDKVAKTVTPIASQGIQMGGMGYQQAVADVLQRPFDELEKTSQVYRDALDSYRADGLSDTDAKQKARDYTAGIAGRQAAIVAGSLAAIAAPISHLSEHPFEVKSLAHSAGDVLLKQPLEGGVINMTGQLAQNVALRDVVDPNHPLDEGLGKTAGEGALYGLTAATGMQAIQGAPKAVLGAGKFVLKGSGDFAGSVVKAKAERQQAKLDEKSPLAGSKLSTEANQVIADSEKTTTAVKASMEADNVPEPIQNKVTGYLRGLYNALGYDPIAEGFDEKTPAFMRAPLEGVTNKIDVIRNFMKAAKDEKNPDRKTALLTYAHDLVDELKAYKQVPEEIIASLKPESESMKYLRDIQSLPERAEQMTEVKRANESMQADYAKRSPDSVKPVTEAEIPTATGQMKVHDTIMNAKISPETGSVPAIDAVLTHAEKGKIQLTPEQRASLKSSRSFLEARQLFMEARKANGDLTPNERVSDEILTSAKTIRRDGMETPSALNYLTDIRKALAAGDTEKAKSTLAEMGLFVQHMKNKATAYNEHLANGLSSKDRTTYTALSPRSNGVDGEGVRKWYQTSNENGVFIAPGSPESVRTARNVVTDQTALAHVYNGLVDAYPQLGESKIAPVSIHPAIADGVPSEVAAEFRKGTRSSAASAEDYKTQVEADKTKQAEYTKQAPAESVVARNVVEATKPVEVPAPVSTVKPVSEPVSEPVKPKPVKEKPVQTEFNFEPADPQPKVEEPPVTAPTETVPTAEPVTETPVTEKPVEAPASEVAPITESVPSEPVDKAAAAPSAFEDHLDSFGSMNSSASETPARSIVNHLFPKLVSTVKNMLEHAFRAKNPDSGTAPTRTFESENPALNIRQAFSSSENFKKWVAQSGATIRRSLNDEVAKAYQTILGSPDRAERKALYQKAIDKNQNMSLEDTLKFVNLGGLMYVMHENLQSFLNRNYSQTDSRTNAEWLRDGIKTDKGTTINRFKSGKALNIVEELPSGKFAYNTKLLSLAAMAGLHWYLTVGRAYTEMPEDDIKAFFNKPLYAIDKKDLRAIKYGRSISDVKSGIANAITQFWGLNGDRNVSTAYTKGIPEAIAAEVMRGLETLNLIKSESVKLSDEKEFIRFVGSKEGQSIFDHPELKDTFGPLIDYPGAIADAVVVKPEQTLYLGSDELPEAPKRQMHTRTKNNARQISTIEQANKIDYKLNMPLLNLYYHLGMNTLTDLLGGDGQIENRSYYNTEHKDSVKGKNLTVTSAAHHIVELVNQMANRGENTGEHIGDMPIRYAHNIAKNGRLYQLGAQNPVGNKLIREVVLPTWATLDLANNTDHMQAMSVATAQALGAKVEKESLNYWHNYVQGRLTGDLAPVMDLLTDWMKGHGGNLHENPGQEMGEVTKFGNELNQALRDANVPQTANALHALLEQARLSMASPEEKASFHTGLYLEADGKTNGPINAMMMLANGLFNTGWIKNIRKGGVTFGSEGKAFHSLDAIDKVDLYKEAADHTKGYFVQTLHDILNSKDGHKTVPVAESVKNLIDRFLPDFTISASDQAEIGRGVLKNPLTISMYGSKMQGIARNIVDELTGKIYEHLTEASRRLEADPNNKIEDVMFPDAANPQQAYRGFIQDLNNVLGKELRRNKSGEYYITDKGIDHRYINEIDPKSHKFHADNLDVFANSVRLMVVEPMSKAIRDTVGSDVMDASELVQTATNKHSIVYSEFIKNEVAKAQAELAKQPDYVPGDYISQAKMDEIIAKAEPLAPMIMDKDQAILIAKAATLSDEKLEYSRALDNRFGTPAEMDMPAPAGVAGMPASIISKGDAYMIQQILHQIHERIMPVYDGLHMPLDKINEFGQVANKSAQEAMMNNPVAGIRDSFFRLLPQLDVTHEIFAQQEADYKAALVDPKFIKDNTDKSDPDAVRKAATFQKMTLASQLIKAIYGPNVDAFQNHKDFSNIYNKLISHMFDEGGRLNGLAASIEARHNVMKQVGWGVDHMASAASPYHNGVTADIDTSSHESTRDALNKLYEVEHKKTQEAAPELPEKVQNHEDYLHEQAIEANPETFGLPLSSEFNQSPDGNFDSDTTEPVRSTGTSYEVPTAPSGKSNDEFRDLTKTVGREDKATGVQILSQTAVRKLARKMGLSDGQKEVLSQIFRAGGHRAYQIVAGGLDQLLHYGTRTGSTVVWDEVSKGGLLHGVISTNEGKIYLINPTPETFTHELIHAATFEAVATHYAEEAKMPVETPVKPKTKEAVGRLESMMNDFLELDPVTEAAGNSDMQTAIENAQHAIDSAQNNMKDPLYMRQAKSVNEFMAWTLSNKALGEKTKSLPAKLLDMAKNTIQAIKNIVWGTKVAPKVADDMFSNVLFNSGIVMNDRTPMTTDFMQATLQHAEAGLKQHVIDLRNSLVKNVISHLDDLPTTTKENRIDKIIEENKFILHQAENASLADAMRVTFPMTMGEANAFNLMTAALAADSKLDPTFLTRANEIYQHVIKNVEVKDFIDPNETDQLVAESMANDRYNVIMGNHLVAEDAKGRSSILPTFIALSQIDDQFRDTLSRISKPKFEKSDATSTTDRWLNDLANRSLEHLASAFTGDLGTKNVLDAMDALAHRVNESVQDEKLFLTMAGDKLNGVVDYANDKTVELFQYMSDKGVAKGEEMKSSTNALTKNLGGIVQTLSALASDKHADLAGESIIATMNRAPIREWMQKTAIDMVGRTNINAPIYDMIKLVRSTVSQLRQSYREKVPEILNSKFKKGFSDKQKSHVFYGMGKSDLASLMEGNSADDVLHLLSDSGARESRIASLEDKIQQADPANWNLYKRKMDELAEKSINGKSSSNLLRNAYAISKLNGEGIKNKPVLDSDVIRAIDHLTTLYALNKLHPDVANSLSSLVQNEPDGMRYMLTYLDSQRKGEMEKVGEDPVLLHNHIKGFIPSQQQMGTSLRVANDEDAAELRLQGYHRVGNYNGSNLERGESKQGYYFAPLNGLRAFSQGIIQNIDHTASGIDSVTGFSTHQVAGRITNEASVARLAKLMKAGAERGETEHLQPLYDSNGQVYAFERTMDHQMMKMTKPSEDVSKMIGIWRGRQVEEHMAVAVNHALVDKAHKMWMDSNATNVQGDRKGEFVNLFDMGKLDPVRQDAIRLFSDDTQKYIESKFGKDTFMVRNDLIDDVIGYRQPSIGDMWTGNSKWSKPVQDAVRNSMISFFGPDAYKGLMKTEEAVQGFMADMRRNIAVKSMIVPAMNLVSNMYQLASRGVPISTLKAGVTTKLYEIHTYNKARLREIELEADLHAAQSNPREAARIKAELQSIKDSYQRMSIAPLINNGEFSTIAGIGDTADDLQLSSGHVSQWLEQQANKLPPGLKTAARYGLVARDTALYQGLERLAEYGDFISKGILYDHLTKNKKMSSKDALAKITEEYVNYDRLPGRSRSFLDNSGLLWFYNYKVRIAKIGLSMMRNNPVHALIAGHIPAFAGTGSVISDNIFAKLLNGHLKYSIGPMMAPHGMNIGPFWSLVN